MYIPAVQLILKQNMHVSPSNIPCSHNLISNDFLQENIMVRTKQIISTIYHFSYSEDISE